jgi:hypothetical protein
MQSPAVPLPRSPPRIAFGFDRTPATTDLPEMDRTAGPAGTAGSDPGAHRTSTPWRHRPKFTHQDTALISSFAVGRSAINPLPDDPHDSPTGRCNRNGRSVMRHPALGRRNLFASMLLTQVVAAPAVAVGPADREGECTHSHKLVAAEGAWTVASGPQRQDVRREPATSPARRGAQYPRMAPSREPDPWLLSRHCPEMS